MRTHTTEQRRRYHANYMAKPENRTKRKAREVCADAIKSGKLVRQPCETCSATKTEAHHDDYSKPLEIRWLCKPCHMEVHRGEPKSMPKRDHCQRGHAFTGHNILLVGRGDGRAKRRKCRQCHNERSRAA